VRKLPIFLVLVVSSVGPVDSTASSVFRRPISMEPAVMPQRNSGRVWIASFWEWTLA